MRSGGDVVAVPVGGGEYGQAVGEAGLVALFAGFAELPGGGDFAADAGLDRVDRAAGAHADLGVEGDAARLLGPGATKHHAVRAERVGQIRWHGAGARSE